jgi:hypothetical protein
VNVNWIEKNKAMRRPCLWDVVRGSWMGFAIGPALIAGNAQAQTGSAGSRVSMIGKISSVTGSAITVMSNSGPVVVKFADETIIRGEVPVKFSDIPVCVLCPELLCRKP